MNALALLTGVLVVALFVMLGGFLVVLADRLYFRLRRWSRLRAERRAKAATVNEWMRSQRGKP